MSLNLIAALTATALFGAFALGLLVPKSISTQITIDAPASAVWQVLVQTDDYADWNTFMPRLDGTLAKGNQLSVTIHPPQGKPMDFAPIVRTLQPHKELRWVGHLGLRGIFDGEHYFILEPQASGATLLRHGETFTGILAHLLFPLLKDKTTAGFTAMNHALKHRAEGLG